MCVCVCACVCLLGSHTLASQRWRGFKQGELDREGNITPTVLHSLTALRYAVVVVVVIVIDYAVLVDTRPFPNVSRSR